MTAPDQPTANTWGRPEKPVSRNLMKKQFWMGLLFTVVSVGLSIYTDRTINDQNLVIVYRVAAGIHLTVAVHAAYRLSNWERPTH